MVNDAAALRDRIDRHLAAVTRRRARKGLPAPQVLVQAPGLEYSAGDRELPFHAASVGKLATAALVMQEVEAGSFTLGTPVSDLLGAEEIDGLFAAPGATVEQLLSHTSGVADYFEDKVSAGVPMQQLLVENRDQGWTQHSLLAFTRERQHPVGTPGQRFHYSDTGYILLGRILEEVTARTYTELLRTRVLNPAGMTSSALWQREEGPERIAPLWLGTHELSSAASLTCDWSGGGIVATVDDLARFSTALRDGTLVRRETWELMTQPRGRFARGMPYGLGTMQLRLGQLSFMPGLGRPTGHLGVLGVHCFSDGTSTVILNFHSTLQMRASFRTHIRIAQLLAKAK